MGVALILIIIDGTKSLAADALVMTSLADAWMLLHADSLAQTAAWAEENNLSGIWEMVLSSVLAWPGFLVTGIPGVIFAFAGRSRATQVSNIGQV